jgi:hypothetical protein
VTSLVTDLAAYLVFAVPVAAGLGVLLWGVWRGRR